MAQPCRGGAQLWDLPAPGGVARRQRLEAPGDATGLWADHPVPPGAAPMSHFQVVEVTYVDGSVERVPAENVVSPSGRRSDTAYLVSLTVGVPTVLLLVLGAFDDAFDAAFGVGTLGLAMSSALGCALAVAGLRSGARRLRVAALVLTLVPAGVILAHVGFVIAFVVLILGSGNPNSSCGPQIR